MTITKLKAKNQLTIPNAIIKRLGLKLHEMFMVDVEKGYIKLTPVKMEPKYSVEELETLDRIVENEKAHGKVYKPGKDFYSYIKKISK